MNKQERIDYIESNLEHYDKLTIPCDSYASRNRANFTKILHNGYLQFIGWTGNREGIFNVNLNDTDHLEEIYRQLVHLNGVSIKQFKEGL